MPSRREFLKTGAMVTTGAALGAAGERVASAVAHTNARGQRLGGNLRAEEVLDPERMKAPGRFHEATIPDTLDLADRARLAVHNLTHNVDPSDFYYVFQAISFGSKSPGPSLHSRTWNITPKNARALPWMRTVCGSNEGLDQEFGMMKAMLSQVGQDGLLYYPADNDGPPKNTSYPDTTGLLALACENYYALDGNPRWLDWIQHLASGLEAVAIRIDDRAYYPAESSIDPQGKWLWTLRGKATLPYHPPDEPYLDQQGFEGLVKFEQGYALRSLVRAYRYRSDKEASDLARRIVRFDLKPGMWENTTLQGYKGNEHGIFGGHFHGNVSALLSLLDVAEADRNAWLKEFVREAYDHAVRNGVVRIGWFPAWITPTEYERPEASGHHSETCGVGEMIELGVRLSDAGLGEYWDDIDAIARNQLIEQQFTDAEVLRRMSKGTPGIEQYVGGFCEVYWVHAAPPLMFGCCSANGSMGLYYAWEGITRFRDGVATVNLFLNRASPWMDVDSYLPYEGRVELRNKQARMALVRIPNWVQKEQVKASVNGRMANPGESRRYLIFENLRKGDVIRLDFPNPESTEPYTIAGQRYQVKFRGSTVLAIDPSVKDPELIPLYQRAQYQRTSAPMRTVQRFVPEKVLPLQ